jgi:hypothetical protein
LKANYFILEVSIIFLVVSIIFLVESIIIFDESDAIGAIVESLVTVVVESEFVSVLEEPPLQAANNAEAQAITNNFFILINLDF